MTNTIAFISIKGGVGKTTLALEVAASLVNDFQKKVLLVDANFSAPNIGLYLDLTNEFTLHNTLDDGTPLHNAIYEAHGIDVIPASMYYENHIDTSQLKKILDKFKKRYDFIIIDSSPNYEELKPVVEAADRIFVVTSPDHVTLETSLKAAHLAKEQHTPIEGIIVNKIRSPKHEYNLAQIEELSEIPVIAKIKEHKEIAAALYNRTPLIIHAPRNVISKEIRAIASAISGQPELQKSIFQRWIRENLVGKEKVNRDMLRQKFYESQFN